MPPIFVSIIFYLIVLAVCETLRRLADVLLADSKSKIYVYEFLAVLEICTCFYENHAILQHYGMPGFFVTVLILLNCHRYLGRGALASPSFTVEYMIDGKFLITIALGLLVAQLLGGIGAFKLAEQIWWFEFGVDHAFKTEEFNCDLAYKVPLWLIASFEFFGGFLIRTIIGATTRHCEAAVPFVTALCFAAGLSCGVLIIGSPGLNPIVAFARFFGCKGINRFHFFLVYWIASIAGWMTAYATEISSRKNNILRPAEEKSKID